MSTSNQAPFKVGDLVYHKDAPECVGTVFATVPELEAVEVDWSGIGVVFLHGNETLRIHSDANTRLTPTAYVVIGGDGGGAGSGVSTSQPSEHSHTWVTYTGLNETFEYCSVCDQKRGES